MTIVSLHNALHSRATRLSWAYVIAIKCRSFLYKYTEKPAVKVMEHFPKLTPSPMAPYACNTAILLVLNKLQLVHCVRVWLHYCHFSTEETAGVGHTLYGVQYFV